MLKAQSVLVCCFLLVLPASTSGAQSGQRQQSLQPGIARTRQDLQNISKIIDENHQEMNSLIDMMGIEMAGVAAGPQTTRLAEAVKLLSDSWGTFSDSYNGSKNDLLKPQDPWIRLSDALKVVMDVVGVAYPLVGAANATTDIAVSSAQFAALHVETDQLELVRARLQQALLTLQAKDALTKDTINKDVARAIKEISARQQITKDLLATYYKDKPNLITLAIKNPPKSSAKTASQIARGVSVVDPNQGIWNLSSDPQINPDFIAALKKCAQIGAVGNYRGWYQDAMTCDKYPDGSYISAIGSGRGTNPANTNSVSGRNGSTPTSARPNATGGTDPSLLSRWNVEVNRKVFEYGKPHVPYGQPDKYAHCENEPLELHQNSNGTFWFGYGGRDMATLSNLCFGGSAKYGPCIGAFRSVGSGVYQCSSNVNGQEERGELKIVGGVLTGTYVFRDFISSGAENVRQEYVLQGTLSR